MNCFAGLALMKFSPFDRPKTINMNTLKTNFEMQQEMIRRLFQELFLIQIQLEKYTRLSGRLSNEISALILLIDQLLEFLMSQFVLE